MDVAPKVCKLKETRKTTSDLLQNCWQALYKGHAFREATAGGFGRDHAG